jgi:hypothetical protein
MVTLGYLFFFFILFLAFWVLLFLFTIVVPGAIKLSLLNKFGPTWAKRLAGLED